VWTFLSFSNMPLDSTKVLLKVWGTDNKLILAKPFPNREQATQWMDDAEVVAGRSNMPVRLKYCIENLPPRI
jgi:hypothetical protein